MPHIALTKMAFALMRANLRHEGEYITHNNDYISRDEQKDSTGMLTRGVEQARAQQPPGGWVHIDEATDAAMQTIKKVLGKVNQSQGPGKAFLSAEEVRKATALDPDVGAKLAYARNTLRDRKKGEPLWTEFYRVPRSWEPAFNLTEGHVRLEDGVPVLHTSQNTEGAGDLLQRGTQLVWDTVLKHRVWDGKADLSGSKLRLGSYTDPETNIPYEVIDWVDVDDASHTWYLRRQADNSLKVEIVQYSG